MKERKMPWWFRKRREPEQIRMSTDHTVISSVSVGLVRLIREQIGTGVLEDGGGIGLCRPSDRGDRSLVVYLYDMRENDQMRINGMEPVDDQYLRLPSLYLDLYYMITSYSTVDARYRIEEEQKLLGRVMQIFNDNSVLDHISLKPVDDVADENLRVELLNLDTESKMKIWNGLNEPFRPSIFYQVGPVELESRIRRRISRVKEIQVDLPLERQ